jgi:nucleotide-binding universal stress UspA family protein
LGLKTPKNEQVVPNARQKNVLGTAIAPFQIKGRKAMKTLVAIVDNPNQPSSFTHYAAHLANDLKMNLHLMHVKNPHAYPLGVPYTTGTETVYVNDALQKLSEQQRKRLAEEGDHIAGQIADDITVEHSVEIGVKSNIINDLNSDGKADMVILEESYENYDFWASDASIMDVVRNVDCPIWIVPHGYNYMNFEKIVYATNYKQEDIVTIRKLIALMGKFNPRLIALHITETLDFKEDVEKEGFMELLKSKTNYNNLDLKALVEGEEDNLADLINGYAQRVDANLVVLLKENRNFLERLFRSSATKKIIKSAGLPVLVYHEK